MIELQPGHLYELYVKHRELGRCSARGLRGEPTFRAVPTGDSLFFGEPFLLLALQPANGHWAWWCRILIRETVGWVVLNRTDNDDEELRRVAT